jgi:hypothetical protein
MIYLNTIPTSPLTRLVGFFLLLYKLPSYQQMKQEPTKGWNKGRQEHEYEEYIK